ncbi:3-methyl-2-oxobutanoate hydroxymethyltransferase [Halobacteriales archaeon QS_3_64_16]|nr:MAG: 3-methyl-2-oxobutanoate hydroxymethyltransferase [Halobacteriales archaeon QS_3_64_16]
MPRTVRDFRADTDEPLTMLTAYDAPTAAICEAAGIDALLVGDSVGNAALGYDSTLPVTVEEIASRTGAISRATEEPLVIADLPFLSFGVEEAQSIRNAGRMVKEAGANAVKIESGSHTVSLTERLVELGIPVLAHLGLTPQRVNELGYAQQGDSEETAERIAELACEHERAGAFALVLEHVPEDLAREVTEELSVPTIGIGAGPGTDGQVLVVDDVIGLSTRSPPFAESFGDVRGEMEGAIGTFAERVSEGAFPAEEDSSDAEVEDDAAL